MSLKQIESEIGLLLSEQADQLGIELSGDYEEAVQFATERAVHLSTITHEPGFDEAVQAERDSVVLRLTSLAIERADDVDRRFVSIVGRVLSITARAMAIAVI